MKYIVHLPEKKDCQPRYFQKNTLCFAMYPDSTEFFPAFIVDNMIKKEGQNCCALIFDDDIDEDKVVEPITTSGTRLSGFRY